MVSKPLSGELGSLRSSSIIPGLMWEVLMVMLPIAVPCTVPFMVGFILFHVQSAQIPETAGFILSHQSRRNFIKDSSSPVYNLHTYRHCGIPSLILCTICTQSYRQHTSLQDSCHLINNLQTSFFHTSLIPCGKFQSPYLGKAKAATRAALSIPNIVCLIFVCTNEDMSENALDL